MTESMLCTFKKERVCTVTSQNGFESIWMEQYGELLDFYERTITDPLDYKPNHILGTWVQSPTVTKTMEENVLRRR